MCWVMLQITKYLRGFHNNKYTRVMFVLLIKRITTGFLTVEYVEISKKILHFLFLSGQVTILLQRFYKR